MKNQNSRLNLEITPLLFLATLYSARPQLNGIATRGSCGALSVLERKG